MGDYTQELKPTFSIPGPGGSLGKCALCGKDFLFEILMGKTVAMITCSWCPDQRLPMHKECADRVEGSKLATDLPPGPLRTMWEESQEHVEPAPGDSGAGEGKP